MALETKDINNAADMQRYVEGCLNDLMEGLSTKDETMKYLHDYTLRVINLTAERVSKNPDTNDEALPIGDVVLSEAELLCSCGKPSDSPLCFDCFSKGLEQDGAK